MQFLIHKSHVESGDMRCSLLNAPMLNVRRTKITCNFKIIIIIKMYLIDNTECEACVSSRSTLQWPCGAHIFAAAQLIWIIFFFNFALERLCLAVSFRASVHRSSFNVRRCLQWNVSVYLRCCHICCWNFNFTQTRTHTRIKFFFYYYCSSAKFGKCIQVSPRMGKKNLKIAKRNQSEKKFVINNSVGLRWDFHPARSTVYVDRRTLATITILWACARLFFIFSCSCPIL